MENKERQILSEIKEMMAYLRSQMEALESKMDEFQQLVNKEDADMDPIDLDIDDMMAEPVMEPELMLSEPEPVDIVEDDLPVFDEPEPVEVADDDLPFDDVPETFGEPEIKDISEQVGEPADEPIPVEEPMAETVPEPVEEQEVIPEPKVAGFEPKVAVIDSMTDRQAWRTDMPGSHVRDIRSAISLNDRILFINSLFGQDPMAFQESLTKINQMTSLDEVVSYVVAERPEWDLGSETVYRFMMAVRRKVEE